MSSSSTEPPGRRRPSARRSCRWTAAASCGSGSRSRSRVAALLSPLVGSTSAQFTDSAEVSITFFVTPEQP